MLLEVKGQPATCPWAQMLRTAQLFTADMGVYRENASSVGYAPRPRLGPTSSKATVRTGDLQGSGAASQLGFLRYPGQAGFLGKFFQIKTSSLL
jgi:hypothetical protein